MARRFCGAQVKAWIGIIAMLALIAWSGCGGGGSGGSGSDGTGRISFRIQWDRNASTLLETGRAGVDDCLDVDTVTAAVFTDSAILGEGGPWSCTDGRGSISDVLAGNTVRVSVLGHGPNGLALYRGESQPFFLPAGGSVDAGLIVAGSFVPVLSAPADGAILAPLSLVLRWSAVDGASGYRVTIYTDSSYSTVVQTISADASATPSCRPDVDELAVDTLYYWRVQALDPAGNRSQPSAGRSFSISDQALVVTIVVPPDNAMVLDSSATTFDANVTDPDGNPLSSADLASVVWRSDRDGIIGTQLNFSVNPITAPLSVNTHVITLDVTDNNDLTGTASITLQVVDNLPPVVTIITPADGDNYDPMLAGDLYCEGSATDPEEGNVTALNMQWQVVRLSDMVTIWSDIGDNTYADYLQFSTGTYRITLTATDQGAPPASGTATGSASINITVP